MNVAILGCGYVGTAVAHYWRHQLGFCVTATTTTQERTKALASVAQRVLVIRGDDAEGLRSGVQNQDTVLLSVGAPNADSYEETYLQTAQALVKVLQQASTVRQLIYTGSYAVYGDQEGAWVDEAALVAPANPNGQILYDTEQVLLSASSETLDVCIFRLGGIYGPGRELVKILGRAAGTTRPGKGEDATNWIHLDDIVAAIEFARRQRLQGIYNLVDDAKLTSRELFDLVCQQHNLPPVSWASSQVKGRPYNARVSNQKLKAAGYQFIHSQRLL